MERFWARQRGSLWEDHLSTAGPDTEFIYIVDTCEFFKRHISHLRTARIFVKLTPQQAETVIQKDGDVAWANALSYLPILEQFHYVVLVDNALAWENTTEAPAEELNRLTEIVTRILKDRIYPVSLTSQGDDKGLSEVLERFHF